MKKELSREELVVDPHKVVGQTLEESQYTFPNPCSMKEEAISCHILGDSRQELINEVKHQSHEIESLKDTEDLKIENDISKEEVTEKGINEIKIIEDLRSFPSQSKIYPQKLINDKRMSIQSLKQEQDKLRTFASQLQQRRSSYVNKSIIITNEDAKLRKHITSSKEEENN